MLCMIMLLFSMMVSAQTNVAKPKVAKDTSAPKLVVKFGPYTDSSKTIISAMKQLLKNELKVTDSKGNAYTIVKFNFAWRKKDITDDFKTGIPKIIFIYNEISVDSDAHIPASWQKELQASLQSKEELFFDEILVQNTKTKKLVKAPSLRLLVQ